MIKAQEVLLDICHSRRCVSHFDVATCHALLVSEMQEGSMVSPAWRDANPCSMPHLPADGSLFITNDNLFIS